MRNHADVVSRQLAREQAAVDGVEFDSDVDTIIDADNEVLGEVGPEDVSELELPALPAVFAQDERSASTIKRWVDMSVIVEEMAA
jgi:hypothetical protein